MIYNIERFIKAQEGLGYSEMAIYYSIENIEEAKQYCLNETLYNRYRLCCTILLNAKEKDINLIMGYIDAMKLKSSLTLFYYADKDNNELYKQLIDKYFNSKFDELTIKELKSII